MAQSSISAPAKILFGLLLLTLCSCGHCTDAKAAPQIFSIQRTGFESSLTRSELLNKMKESCTDPESPTCDWYPRCIEKAHPCGPNGYVRNFGYKYCQKFAAAKDLSPIGEQWRDKTMVCLQQALVPMLGASGPSDAVCKEIEEVGFDAHVRCYTSAPSICELPWSDLFNIMDIIGPGFLDPTGMKQAADAIAICLCEWSGVC